MHHHQKVAAHAAAVAARPAHVGRPRSDVATAPNPGSGSAVGEAEPPSRIMAKPSGPHVSAAGVMLTSMRASYPPAGGWPRSRHSRIPRPAVDVVLTRTAIVWQSKAEPKDKRAPERSVVMRGHACTNRCVRIITASYDGLIQIHAMPRIGMKEWI
jgi:hypothetical protein